MFHLIKKDLLIQKNSFLLSILLIIFFSLIFSNMGAAGLTMSVLAVTYLLTLGASAREEKNNSDKLLISLPLRRRTIVFSKYVSVLFFATYAILLNLVIYGIINILKLPLESIPITLQGVISAFIVSLLYCSISFPLIFKVGYMKSRMMNLFLFLGIVFGASWVLEKIIRDNEELGNYLLNSNVTELTTVGLLITVIIFIASYLLSLTFYKNREF